MERLPQQLYSASQVREIDRLAIEVHGIPGIVLMERAAQALFNSLRSRWPEARRIVCCCGIGNNGGDGYLLARIAHQAGLDPVVVQVGEASRITGDALEARRQVLALGVVPQPFSPGLPLEGELLVDALLGTGISGEVTGQWRDAIEALNRSSTPILAVDIPSGIDADSGARLGCAVEAAATVSFIALKCGLFTGEGPAHSGSVRFADLGVASELYREMTPRARRIGAVGEVGGLARRRRDGHKGDYGHLLVVGGDRGYSGAVRLTAEAALRVGAGLVSVATHPNHAATLNVGRPEMMVHSVESTQGVRKLLPRATVVALGPGLGQQSWGMALFAAVMQSQLPLVVDADGLNLLAHEPQRREGWVLTPHPGEAARLLGCNRADIGADRLGAAASIAQRFGATVILKGAGSIVQGPGGEVPLICSGGNPGMASGGMGDLLTGVVAALMAQGLDGNRAAELATVVHASAGDSAAQSGERGVLAADLLPYLRIGVNC